ncbi:MAG: hypothetical protein ARM1_0491 [Candidatus Micrarchaeota archaeon]|nr:MAG: hypothetical protein ARM1_0491 [Candidatus Micrarchaeota archaeon]
MTAYNDSYKVMSKFESDIKDLFDDAPFVIGIVHRQDLDGVGSGAMIEKVCERFNKRSIILYSNYDREDAERLYNQLSDAIKRYGIYKFLAIVSDISINEQAVDLYKKVFELIEASNGKLVFLDHHAFSERVVEILNRYADIYIIGDDPENTGATLTYREFARKLIGFDKALFKIYAIALATDLGLFTVKETESFDTLYKVISYANDIVGVENKDEADRILDKVKDLLKSGSSVNDNKELLEITERYKREEEKILNDIISKSIYIEKGRYKVAVATSLGKYDLDASVVCDTLKLKYPESNLRVYIKNAGQVRLRSNGDIDCARISKAFGGNGHIGAAGFVLKDIDKNNIDAINDLIDRIISIADKLN